MLGVLLGLLTILKIVDLGFTAILARHFDLVLDWVLLGDATGVVAGLARHGSARARRDRRLPAGDRDPRADDAGRAAADPVGRRPRPRRSARSPGSPSSGSPSPRSASIRHRGAVASRADASLVGDRFGSIRNSLHDQADFKAQAKVDPYKTTPGNQLLNGLRGKDVVITFVESYGAVRGRGPEVRPAGGRRCSTRRRKRLDAAGFGSRSAFLTSSTVGGGSWLAHSTLLSGL